VGHLRLRVPAVDMGRATARTPEEALVQTCRLRALAGILQLGAQLQNAFGHRTLKAPYFGRSGSASRPSDCPLVRVLGLQLSSKRPLQAASETGAPPAARLRGAGHLSAHAGERPAGTVLELPKGEEGIGSL
jgi:hypothetical protein